MVTKRQKMDSIKEYFSFKGRIKRVEFFATNIILVILDIAIVYPLGLLVPANIDAGQSRILLASVQVIVFLPIGWTFFASVAKRFRDMGVSPWHSLWLLIFPLGGLSHNYYAVVSGNLACALIYALLLFSRTAMKIPRLEDKRRSAKKSGKPKRKRRRTK
jgi:uncharacterized membrane protein YhaH (DUF805 family)